MNSETGETSAAINRRSDENALHVIRDALADGAMLRVHPKVRRVAVQNIDDRDPPYGRTIGYSALRRLEAAGEVELCGVNLYRSTGEQE